MKITTEEEFIQFINEDIPCALFHVGKEDLSDETGGKLEEEILIRCLADSPGALKFKPLQWFINSYLK